MPRYLQVASVLRRRIRDGRWAVGAKIATLEELEREFGVARVTVRQAIDLLQSEGLRQVVPGPRHLRHQGPDARALDPARHRLGEPDRADPRQRPASCPPARSRRPASRRATERRRRPTSTIRSIQKQRRQPYAYARVHVAAHVHARAPEAFRLPRRRWRCCPRWRTWRSRAPTRRSPSAPPIWRPRATWASR